MGGDPWLGVEVLSGRHDPRPAVGFQVPHRAVRGGERPHGAPGGRRNGRRQQPRPRQRRGTAHAPHERGDLACSRSGPSTTLKSPMIPVRHTCGRDVREAIDSTKGLCPRGDEVGSLGSQGTNIQPKLM